MPLPDASTLPPQRERLLLLTLGAIQFTHIMDYMIMMPLGSSLMRVFGISPGQFSLLVAAYGLSAAIAGFIGGFFLDRFDRRSALLGLFTGFGLATLACALSPNYHVLLLARFAAGAFGGVAGSVVTAMVGDAIPAARRGRAMGQVMAAYPLATILGIPLGLFLAGWLGWHAPFYLLALLCGCILTMAYKTLPHVTSHRSLTHPMRQMVDLMTHHIHLRGFLLTASLIFSGAIVVPFMAPAMVANVGLDEQRQLPLIYLFGGACTFFTMPWFGRLADRYDKVKVLIAISLVAVPAILMTTRLGPGHLYLTYLTTTLFFIGMSGRFAPAMALITNAVDARYRGGFMSVNSAAQQAAAGIANLVAGLIVVQGPHGRLLHYEKVGLLSCAAFGCTIALAFWLRAAAPQAAQNIEPMLPAEPAT